MRVEFSSIIGDPSLSRKWLGSACIGILVSNVGSIMGHRGAYVSSFLFSEELPPCEVAVAAHFVVAKTSNECYDIALSTPGIYPMILLLSHVGVLAEQASVSCLRIIGANITYSLVGDTAVYDFDVGEFSYTSKPAVV